MAARGGSYPDTHTKWVIAVVSAAIVATLGTFLMLDRNRIALTSELANARSLSNQQRLEVQDQRTNVRLGNIEGDVKEIKEMVRELQRKQEK